MNTTMMACYSCIRKPIKCLLLFLVVFAISIFMLSALATKNANIATQDKTKQAIGAGFVLTQNQTNRHKRIDEISKILGENEGVLDGLHQKKTIVDGSTSWQTWTDNSFETLTLKDIKKIAKIKGISNYNITTKTTAVNPVNFDRMEDLDSDQSSDVLGVSLVGNKDMAMDSNVLSGNVSMKYGRMVEQTDINVCVISEELATKNHLKVGDTLAFNNYHDKEDATVYKASIIGIYQVKQKLTPMMTGDTYRSENIIFTDLRFPEKAEGNRNDPLFEKAYFKVKNVNQYNSIKEEIKNADIEWERYDLFDNNGNLETMSINFNDLGGLSQILIYVVVGASFIILCLVFVFWMKNRAHEIAILLSLGTSKLKIIYQIWLEAILISLFAICISYLIAPYVSQLSASYLVDSQVLQAKENKLAEDGKVETTYTETNQIVKDVNVDITSQMMMIHAVGITLLISASLIIAAISIIRKNPKDILSERS